MPEMEVLIVDDHAFIHETLAAVVRKAVPGALVRAADSLEKGITQARTFPRRTLVLLDLGLPGCSGIESLTRFRHALPNLRVTVVTADEDSRSVHAAFDAGAVGYIPKSTAPSVMVAAIRLIAEGGIYFPPQLMNSPLEDIRTIDLTEVKRGKHGKSA